MSRPDNAQHETRELTADKLQLLNESYQRVTTDGEEYYWIPEEQHQPPHPVQPGNPHSNLPAYILPARSFYAPPSHSLSEAQVADIWGYHKETGSVELFLNEAQTLG